MALWARIGVAAMVLAAAGCGSGSGPLGALNPFGQDRSQQIEAARARVSEPVVDQVVSLNVDPTPGGVIVSAVGLPPTQGFWEAQLVPVESPDPSVFLLEFRVLPPPGPARAGSQPSREVLAGAVFSTQDLAGVRTITVRGLQNQRSVSR